MSENPTDKLASEIADILKQVKQLEDENQKLKEEIEKLRSLLLQVPRKETKAKDALENI